MKRFVALIIVLFSLFFIAPRLDIAYAQGWRDESFGKEFDAADEGDINNAGYIDRVTKGNMASISCQIIPVIDLCTTNPDKLQSLYERSAIGNVNRYIAMMYANPPANLALWIRDTGQSLGFIPRTAHAQGIGFSGLAPLLPIWKAFRNIAYLLLAIIMVFIGFMVMFRKQIDQKTVVTVQNALPRIVLTLILITFSYAIVGFMIDIMYIVFMFTVKIIVGSSNDILKSNTLDKYLSGGAWTLSGALFGGGFSTIDDIITLIIPRKEFIEPIFTGMLGDFAGKIALFFYNINAFPGRAVFSIILGFIFSLLLLFTLLRITFMLLNAYIQIILALIIGPLQLLTEALPGSNGFSSWLKGLMINLMVFPLTAALLLIGTYIAQSNIGDVLWVPPFIATKSPTAGTSAGGFAGLISLGIFVMIPSIINSIKEALKIKPAVPLGIGSIGQPFSAVYSTAMSGISQMYYVQMIRQQIGERGLGSLIGLGKKQGGSSNQSP